MILGPPPEPLRGEVLRMALRALLLPPMPPPPDPPSYACVEEKQPIRRAPWRGKNSAEKRYANAMKARPPGCISRTEAAKKLGIDPNSFGLRCYRRGIKGRLIKSISWYDEQELKDAGLLS